MPYEPMEPVGRITGVSRPDAFTFTFNPQSKLKLYDYVVVEMLEEPPGSEEPVKVPVVAQVYRLERSMLGFTPDHPWPVIRDYNVPLELDASKAYAKILGYRWRGRIYRPRSAPPVGAWVYRAPDPLLEEFFSVDEPRRLHIGYLISRPSVRAYLDVEGLKRHMAIIAATGAGKTWTSVVLIEELLKKNATILVLDPHGEYVAMKASACAKVKELCGRIRVVKAHRDQVGDLIYRIDVREMTSDELADIAGVPSRATRVRDVIAAAKSIADALSAMFSRRELSSIRWIKEVIGLAASAATHARITAKGERRLEAFTSMFVKELALRLAPVLGAQEREIANELSKRMRSDEALYKQAVRLYASVARDLDPANNAIRYLSSIEEMGVYGTRHIPLDEILAPGSLTIVNLAGLPTMVQDHIASNILRRVFDARVRAVRGLPGESFHYPVVIVVEEAHRFAPSPQQRETRSLPVISMIASEGRKFGAFLVVITQRPSRIHQDVLSQAQSQVILRIVNPRDQQAVRDASEQLSQELFENLPGLDSGEAIVVGPVTPLPLMVRIRDRVLDYAGGDISLVEAWMRSGEEAAKIEKVRAELVKKLSEILGYEVEPSTLHDALSQLMSVPIPRPVLEKGLKLLASGRVVVYGYSRRDMRVTGRVGRYEVEVELHGGVRKCDCGKDSTVEEDAVCPHMVAVVAKAVLEGLVETVPIETSDLIDEI